MKNCEELGKTNCFRHLKRFDWLFVVHSYKICPQFAEVSRAQEGANQGPGEEEELLED